MQEPNIWHRFRDHLAVELQHETQNAVRGRVGRPHVQHHFLTDIVITVPQLGVGSDDARSRIGRLDFTNGECHREVRLCCRVKTGAQAQKLTGIMKITTRVVGRNGLKLKKS
jgi:hypothetical protein